MPNKEAERLAIKVKLSILNIKEVNIDKIMNDEMAMDSIMYLGKIVQFLDFAVEFLSNLSCFA